jgi:hypothetical protein
MATSAEIQKFVQRQHGFVPKMGWIAHVKEVHGIPTLRGANRARGDRDIEPCPPEKRGDRRGASAFRHDVTAAGVDLKRSVSLRPPGGRAWRVRAPR